MPTPGKIPSPLLPAIQDPAVRDSLVDEVRQTYLTDTQRMQPGTIVVWKGSTAPSGWLKCDGATYNTVQFKRLAGALGAGSGTTFTVPGEPVALAAGFIWIVKA